MYCSSCSCHCDLPNVCLDPAESALQTELKVYKQQVKGKGHKYMSSANCITIMMRCLSLAELKDANKDLSEENEQLRGYINRLLIGVLNHSPAVLEVHSCADSVRPTLTQ